jgi:3-oxoacyl-[acyl-carrier protein] reductase
MQIDLQNKTALICGSTKGIGLAIAQAFAAAGARCILLARDEARLKSVLADLPFRDTSAPHQMEVADFADSEQMKEVAEKLKALGPVHILVNNTGGPAPGPITEAKPDQFLAAYQQHLVNNQLLVQALLPGMKQEGYGRIINIISTSVRIPIANLGVSNTTRSAVAAWAKTLSNEVGRWGITVNNILPGLTETDRLNSLIESESKRRNLSREVISTEMQESIPARRFGRPEELAQVACFLASDLASYVNGVSIPVDGGRTGSI